MVGAHVAGRTNALEHDLSAVPVNYDELRWLSPNTIEMKPEFVAIKLCRLEDVIHNKVWRNAIQLLLSAGIWTRHNFSVSWTEDGFSNWPCPKVYTPISSVSLCSLWLFFSKQ